MSERTGDVMVDVRGLHKSFRLPHHQQTTLKGRVLHPRQRTTVEQFEALRDVSFDVRRGEFFGIVGRNGSGKSTLLKLLAGIYQPTSGTIGVHGSMASFIELGVGFNPELSGRDNLFLNGALLGFTRKELKARYDDIVAFAELEEFMDLKLRNFSSGMQVRLGFSIAVELGADILLIDEVLAVGDERFQRKCYEIFRERKRQGATVIFVSHDMGAVQQFCDRVLLIDGGDPVALDDPRVVTREYVKLNLEGQFAVAEKAPADTPEVEDGASPAGTSTRARIDDVWLEDVGGWRNPVVAQNDMAIIGVTTRALDDVGQPEVQIEVNDHKGTCVLKFSTAWVDAGLGPWTAGTDHTVRFEFQNSLGNGVFTVTSRLWDGATDALCAELPDTFEFESDSHPNEGLVNLPYAVKVGTPITAS